MKLIGGLTEVSSKTVMGNETWLRFSAGFDLAIFWSGVPVFLVFVMRMELLYCRPRQRNNGILVGFLDAG